MNKLDMLGNPCPIPVIKAKKEMQKQETNDVCVLVDNIVAVQNLEKMAKGEGYSFSYEETGNKVFSVVLEKSDGSILYTREAKNDILKNEDIKKDINREAKILAKKGESLAVMIKSDQMGVGSEELGKILIKGFIYSLAELENTPKAVVFLNSGVKLAVKNSNTIDDLKELEKKGAKILVCGTCLNYYDLTDQVAIGEVTDMYNIIEEITKADKLVSI